MINIKENKNSKTLLRHKLLLKKISENLGKEGDASVAVGKAMRDLGYSSSYANNPQQLTKTKSWDVLMKSSLDDEILIKHHLELLEAKEVKNFVFPKKMKDKEINECLESAGLKVVVIQESVKGKIAFYSVGNTRAMKDGLDMAFKLRGLCSPEKHINKFEGYSKEALIESILSKIAPKKAI